MVTNTAKLWQLVGLRQFALPAAKMHDGSDYGGWRGGVVYSPGTYFQALGWQVAGGVVQGLAQAHGYEFAAAEGPSIRRGHHRKRETRHIAPLTPARRHLGPRDCSQSPILSTDLRLVPAGAHVPRRSPADSRLP